MKALIREAAGEDKAIVEALKLDSYLSSKLVLTMWGNVQN